MLAGVGVAHLVVLAGDQRGDVRRHPLGGREVPDGRAVAGRRRARGWGRSRRPSSAPGAVTCEREGRLQVGLLERGEHAAGVGHLELGVEVDPLVGRVDEPVQALAGAAVGAGRRRPAARCRPRGRSSGIRLSRVDRDRVERLAVQRDLADRRRRPGRRRSTPRARGTEPDHGRGAEGWCRTWSGRGRRRRTRRRGSRRARCASSRVRFVPGMRHPCTRSWEQAERGYGSLPIVGARSTQRGGSCRQTSRPTLTAPPSTSGSTRSARGRG